MTLHPWLDDPRHWRGTGYLGVARSTGVGLRFPTTVSCVPRSILNSLVFQSLADTAKVVVPRRNVVAVDAVASYLMGFDPASIVYLRIAASAGLGTNDLNAIRVFEAEAGRVVRCDDPTRLRGAPLRVVSRLPGGDAAWL